MRRRLFTLCAAASLLLCAGVCVVTAVLTAQPRSSWVIRDGGGGIGGGSAIATYALAVDDGWIVLGWTHSDVWFEGYVGAPIPILVLLTLLLPAWWVYFSTRRGRRANHDRCSECGYDLRATPLRCPECGAVPGEPPHNPPMHRTGPAV